MKSDKLKVLVFDIETAPMTAYVWGRRDINVALNQIKKEWSVIAWAAKWLGEKQVIYLDQRSAPDIEQDRYILSKLWQLLDQADIVITQNGQSFDSKKLNARFILHGFAPPSPYKHIDTYRIVRNVAGFTSNKLEYLTEKLCTKYKKLSHSKFPGMSLWTECLKGNPRAWNEMKRYNIHDVLSTEELYLKIRAWAPASMPAVYINVGACHTCGKKALHRNGFRITKLTKYLRLRCYSCGAHQIGDKIQ